jgi:5'(3')-deoxyribonucleotidase
MSNQEAFIKELISRPGAKIALDADQVLAQTFGRIAEVLNIKYHTSYTLNDMKEYPKPGVPLLPGWDEPFDTTYDRLWNEDWKSIPKLADPTLFEKACEKMHIDIVTSRGEEAAGPLKEWMKFNYPNVKAKMVIVPKYSDKGLLPYNLYIDDAPRLSESIANNSGKAVLLVDAPYNKSIQSASNILRVNNVDDAFRKLLQL